MMKNENNNIKFIHFFTFSHFSQICEEYQTLFNEFIGDKIQMEFNSEDREIYQNIARYAINKYEFFATFLHKSMRGVGNNTILLIRVVLTRSEIDLQDIKEAFNVMFEKNLCNMIMVSAVTYIFCFVSKLTIGIFVLQTKTTAQFRESLFTFIGEY